MVQVRAEVAERLDGLVSTVADLKSQFEGTIARVYLAEKLAHQKIVAFSPQVGELERMGQGDREGVKLAFIHFQRPKNLGGRVALPSGKFLRVRKVFCA